MKKLVVVVLLMSGVLSIAFSQRTSLNNYTGIWENNASWVGGVAPPVANPANITITHLNLTINGYITRTGNINMPGATAARDFIINDTLVVIGNMSFPNDAAELVIGPNGLLIVIGSMSFGNNTRVTNNGIIAVSQDVTFASGNSEIYDNSGGGEFFVQGNVTLNPAAEGADNWDNLDILYPVLHEFILCKAAGGASCILPVELLYFSADFRDEKVQLHWATVMEENFQRFVIERSNNGINFEELGSVPGQGFNIYDIESIYSFEDYNPIIGKNYYRLKAVDLDERYEYFDVLLVEVKTSRKINLYPNPSSGDILSLIINFKPEETDRIIVSDSNGREVYNSIGADMKNTMVFPHTLRPGVYIVRYLTRDAHWSAKAVVTSSRPHP